MAIFRKRSGEAPGPADATAEDVGWQRLRTRCLPISAARQRRLIDSGAGGAWQLDLEQGMATIGSQPTSIQVLGNSSTSGRSFMFGWHLSELNGFDQRFAQAAVAARSAAGRDGAPVFADDVVSTQDVDEAELASVMSVLGSDAAMYRGPHDNGAIYFTLEEFDISTSLPTEAVLTVAASCLELGLHDHPTAMRSLLEYEGFELSAHQGKLEARRDGDTIVLSLDDRDRVSNIEGELRPRPA